MSDWICKYQSATQWTLTFEVTARTLSAAIDMAEKKLTKDPYKIDGPWKFVQVNRKET